MEKFCEMSENSASEFEEEEVSNMTRLEIAKIPLKTFKIMRKKPKKKIKATNIYFVPLTEFFS